MHISCILDSAANLLVRHMVFVGNVLESPIASHLKGFGPSLDFCCQCLALRGIKEGGSDERPHQLDLRRKRDVLVPPYDLQSRKCSVVWAILERISGFDPSLEMIAPRYLQFSTSSSLWPFILISLWKLLGLFVIIFVLSGPIPILYLMVVVSGRLNRTPVSSSSSAFTTVSSVMRKLVISPPPMLTLPSWSSNASHMILSRKTLKRVDESTHPYRTPTVVLNQSPVLPLNRTAFLASS